MSQALHSRLPWMLDDATGEIVLDAAGELVVDCGARPTTSRDRARANAELIRRVVASHSLLIAMARRLAEPFADIDSGFLSEAASADPGSLHLIGGNGLTAHFAQAILDARVAVALEEDR